MLSFKIISVSTVLLLIVLMCCDSILGISIWWYGLLAMLWLTVMTIGTFSLSWELYVKAFTSKHNLKEKKIAITFDDGPNPEFTLQVLELLKTYNAKATFFCIGKNVESYPKIVKAIYDDGHAIGNHSFSHRHTIDFNSTEDWMKEIKQTDDSVYKVIGTKPKLFRPPFGVTTPKLAHAVKVTEHQVIGWNIRSYDTAINNPKHIVKRIIKRLQPGSVILLHDKQINVLYVLEHLLQFLKKHDYQTVTINELIDEK